MRSTFVRTVRPDERQLPPTCEGCGLLFPVASQRTRAGNSWWPGIIACAAVLGELAGLAVLLWDDPTVCPLIPPCPVEALLGVYCPGCGTARSLHFLLHGQLASAWRMNPMALLGLPLQLVLCWRPRLLRRPAVGYAILVAISLFGLLRNLPVYPFTLFVPRT